MSRGDSHHVGGLLYRWGPVLLVLALLASAAASYRFDLGERWLGLEQGDPVENPGAVAPPESLDLPDAPAAQEVALPITAAEGARIDASKVRTAIGRQFANPDLGKGFTAAISALSGGPPALTAGTGQAIPASTLKVLTAAAALEVFEPGTVFATRVLEANDRRIILVGGGDPYLASRPPSPSERAQTYPARADVVTLARKTATSLAAQGQRAVSLAYDDSLFSGPVASPTWEPGYLPEGVVAPITALWVDRGAAPSGFGRVADPSLRAAEVFAEALERAGIRVRRSPQRTIAPASAAEIARVESPPVEQIVQHVLDVSDNEGSEVLSHQVGLAVNDEASFEAGAAGVLSTLKTLGVDTQGAVLHDGSGLSRKDRLRPQTLVEVLRLAASPEHPELSPVLEGLPVAGFTGSLADRFDEGDPAGRGRVRAKTGTLTGVQALAGVVSDVEGNLMVIVLIANRVAVADATDARTALDRAAASLAACRCGSAA